MICKRFHVIGTDLKLHEDVHEAIMRTVSGEDYTIELPHHNGEKAAA